MLDSVFLSQQLLLSEQLFFTLWNIAALVHIAHSHFFVHFFFVAFPGALREFIFSHYSFRCCLSISPKLAVVLIPKSLSGVCFASVRTVLKVMKEQLCGGGGGCASLTSGQHCFIQTLHLIHSFIHSFIHFIYFFCLHFFIPLLAMTTTRALTMLSPA